MTEAARRQRRRVTLRERLDEAIEALPAEVRERVIVTVLELEEIAADATRGALLGEETL